MARIVENSSGRCLVFSLELNEEGVEIRASKDYSSECPILKRTELAASQDV